MSRIGKLPIALPANTKININNNQISVSDKLGELNLIYGTNVSVQLDEIERKIIVEPKDQSKEARAFWGLIRSLIYNMVRGVSEGYTEILELNGVGYRCAVNGEILTLFLGYSHEIKYQIPKGIEIKCDKPTQISIFGSDKQKVGQVAATIRKLRKPEPYKGKGIKYKSEVIIRKEGKKK